MTHIENVGETFMDRKFAAEYYYFFYFIGKFR